MKHIWGEIFFKFHSYIKVANTHNVPLVMYLHYLKKLSRLAQYTIR